jgi:hypothetical protein
MNRTLRRGSMKAHKTVRRISATPIVLKNLARFLWHNEPLVISKDRVTEPPKTEFPKRFTLRRSGSLRTAPYFSWFIERKLNPEFFKSLLLRRLREEQQSRKGNVKYWGDKAKAFLVSRSDLREVAIECALAFSLKEWEGIFLDAFQADDYDFVRRVIGRHQRPPSLGGGDARDASIICFWESFQAADLDEKVPPLKYWRDKAVAEFIRFITGERSLELSAYQQRKKRAGLKSEKRKFVNWANYTVNDQIHELTAGV